MTPLGYILLPLALAGFLFAPQWLYGMLVFWSLFSASAAANIGRGEDVSALQIWMMFGTAWLARLSLDHLLRMSFALDRRILRQCMWLCGFILVAAVSLWMPVYIDGALKIMSPVLMEIEETPLHLTSHNITQWLYLLFGGLIAMTVAQRNLRDDARHSTERILLLSAVVLSVWGLVQFFCTVTGMEFPAFLLNNSEANSGQGYLETLEGVGRISSAATEPSTFAQAILSLLPLSLPAWLGGKAVFSRVIDRACTVLFFTVLLLSTSSSAYLGLVLLSLVWVAILLKSHTMKAGKVLVWGMATGVLLMVFLAVLIATVPAAQHVVQHAILEKNTSGSGLERAMTIVLALGYFLKYPVLGIGWGSAVSHDVIGRMLSNVGLVGFAVFLGAMGSVVLQGWRALEPMTDSLSTARAVWLAGFIVYLLLSFAAGFPLAFGNFWVVMGLAIATGWRQEETAASNKAQP